MAVAIARRTCPALGSSERCSADANNALARTALALRSLALRSQGTDDMMAPQ